MRKSISIALLIIIVQTGCGILPDWVPVPEEKPVITIRYLDPDDNRQIVPSKDSLPADGREFARLEIKVTPQIDKPGQRKITLNTTNGLLLHNGEEKKGIEITLDEGSTSNTVLLRAPRSEGAAHLTVSTLNSLSTKTEALTFVPAYPDMIYVELPRQSLKDTSVTEVGVRVSRNIGQVSLNLHPEYRLLDSRRIEVSSASFAEVSPTDSSDMLTCKLILEGTLPGSYILQAKLGDKVGEKTIRVYGK